MSNIFHEMPVLAPIPEKLLSEYNHRRQIFIISPDPKIPQRYKRRSSLFQHNKIERIIDPYSSILQDLGKIQKKYYKADSERGKKNHDGDSDHEHDELGGETDENPILRSHVEMVKKLKSKKEEQQIASKDPERYLPKSMFSSKKKFVVDVPVIVLINIREPQSKSILLRRNIRN